MSLYFRFTSTNIFQGYCQCVPWINKINNTDKAGERQLHTPSPSTLKVTLLVASFYKLYVRDEEYRYICSDA